MEQVQLLLDDRKVHPAAPVVLAGAALDEFLQKQPAIMPRRLPHHPFAMTEPDHHTRR
jgi:hypothetical protein